jgi:hypothetical protein
VSAVDAIALVVALLVAALMVVALLFPERF